MFKKFKSSRFKISKYFCTFTMYILSNLSFVCLVRLLVILLKQKRNCLSFKLEKTFKKIKSLSKYFVDLIILGSFIEEKKANFVKIKKILLLENYS